jgi:integrase/recombinase XerD
LHNGVPIKPEALQTMMNQLKNRISRLIETSEIENEEEKNKLIILLTRKRFNPYCIRHSSISCDSDYLTEYALKKKVRWSMNSRQGSRYIKTRMGNELKNKILEHSGIISQEMQKKKPSVSNCPRCDLINMLENKYCSKCSYALKPEAFDEIKPSEEERIMKLEKKYKKDITDLRTETENRFLQLVNKIDLEKIV